MRKRLNDLRNKDQGFTLTELLIVIVILGVLAGIVVFAVATFTDDAKSTACEADKKNVSLAVDAYYVKNNAYPASIAALVSGKYLKEAPGTGNGYTITVDPATGVVGPAACPT